MLKKMFVRQSLVLLTFFALFIPVLKTISKPAHAISPPPVVYVFVQIGGEWLTIAYQILSDGSLKQLGAVPGMVPPSMGAYFAGVVRGNNTFAVLNASKSMAGTAIQTGAIAGIDAATVIANAIRYGSFAWLVATIIFTPTGDLNANETMPEMPMPDPTVTDKQYSCEYKLMSPGIGAISPELSFKAADGTQTFTQTDPLNPDVTMVACTADCNYGGMLSNSSIPPGCFPNPREQSCPASYSPRMLRIRWTAKAATANSSTFPSALPVTASLPNTQTEVAEKNRAYQALKAFCQATAPADLGQQCTDWVNYKDPSHTMRYSYPMTFACQQQPGQTP